MTFSVLINKTGNFELYILAFLILFGRVYNQIRMILGTGPLVMRDDLEFGSYKRTQ